MTPAEIEANKRFPIPIGCSEYAEPHIRECQKHFIQGATWQKEQDKQLYEALVEAQRCLRLWYNGEGLSSDQRACDNALKALDNYLKQ